MIGRLFLVIGLTFIAISICSLSIILLLPLQEHSSSVVPLKQPVMCGGGCGIFPLLISDGTLYDLQVAYEAPKQMDVNTSDTVMLMLAVIRTPISPIEKTPVPQYDTSNRNIVTTSPETASSLDIDYHEYCLRKVNYKESDMNYCLYTAPSLKNIYGNGYEVYIRSHLIATGFEVQLLDSEEQSANQSLAEWTWNISPKSTGTQMINMGIELRWKPSDRGREDIIRQIWQAPISITVNEPFLERGQINIVSAITGVLGTIFTGFSLVWFYEERKKRQEANIKTNMTKAPYEGQQKEQGNLVDDWLPKPKLRSTSPESIKELPGSPTQRKRSKMRNYRNFPRN